MVRVLIGYASRTGSTADVAGMLAEQFLADGCDVVVADLRDQPLVDDFDVVVAGSAIQMQSWLPEATAWLRLRGPVLREKQVALFNVCMAATETDNPAKRDESLAYNKAAAKVVRPVAVESFGGRYTPEKVGWIARMLFRAQQTEPKDYVEPAKIRAWADALLAQTVAGLSTPTSKR